MPTAPQLIWSFGVAARIDHCARLNLFRQRRMPFGSMSGSPVYQVKKMNCRFPLANMLDIEVTNWQYSDNITM